MKKKHVSRISKVRFGVAEVAKDKARLSVLSISPTLHVVDMNNEFSNFILIRCPTN